MLSIYRLPGFLDYLSLHYQKLDKLYEGRLTELFPSAEANENNLLITDGDKADGKNNELIMQLWKKFTG